MSYTDRRGELWRFEYDARDRSITQIDPLGNAARTEYDPDGLPIRETDEDGRSQEHGLRPDPAAGRRWRDGRGNVVELRYPQAPGDETSSFAPSRIVYPTFEQEMRYDQRNRLTATSEILGAEVRLTRYRYDQAGNRIATVNAEDNTTAYAYDALNRLVRITDTLGHVTELAYDNRDNLIAVTDANAERLALRVRPRQPAREGGQADRRGDAVPLRRRRPAGGAHRRQGPAPALRLRRQRPAQQRTSLCR